MFSSVTVKVQASAPYVTTGLVSVDTILHFLTIEIYRAQGLHRLPVLQLSCFEMCVKVMQGICVT
jgi:hypothetical protein